MVGNLSVLLQMQGKFDVAEHGRDHPDTLMLSTTLAFGLLLKVQGKLNLAKPFLRRSFEGSG